MQLCAVFLILPVGCLARGRTAKLGDDCLRF
jgi:hypothetical protein